MHAFNAAADDYDYDDDDDDDDKDLIITLLCGCTAVGGSTRRHFL